MNMHPPSVELISIVHNLAFIVLPDLLKLSDFSVTTHVVRIISALRGA